MLAMGICRLWGEGWVEAAFPQPEPWAIVAQQAMAATLEGSEWPTQDLVSLLCDAFPELSAQGIGSSRVHGATRLPDGN